MEIIKILTLSLSSLLLLFVGLMRLSNPVKAYAQNSGIKLESDVNLLNEMRGMSAVMLCGGVFTALGIFFSNWTFTSFAFASLIFLGFLIGRCFSITTDGKPNKQIMQGIYFEIMLGVANLFCLLTM